MMLLKSVRKYLHNIIDTDYPESPSYAYSDVELDLNSIVSEMYSNMSLVIVMRIDKDSKGRKFCVGTEYGTINDNIIYSYRLSQFCKNVQEPERNLRAFLITSNKTVKKFTLSEIKNFKINVN